VTRDGVVEVKGLLGKKRNIPIFVKKAFNEVIEILSSVNSPEDFSNARRRIEDTIRSYVRRLELGDYEIEELAFRCMLGKSPEDYVKTTPQHVKVAKILERMGKRIEAGQVIKYVKVSGKDGVMPIELANKSQIDKDKYLEIMRTTFEQILNALDIDFDEIIKERKVSSLDEFF
ncbi:MAG: DNA polymerase domain-containing protein, partial [Candidatus Korarchaeum sp.]